VLSGMQRVLVLALHDERPVERLRELVDAAGDRMDADERRRLLDVDPDALRVTSLIVRKLRLERLLRGDPAAAARRDVDPATFMAAFRRYARAVPPTAAFPGDEARAFRAFETGGGPSA
jgi:hypothetical protein